MSRAREEMEIKLTGFPTIYVTRVEDSNEDEVQRVELTQMWSNKSDGVWIPMNEVLNLIQKLNMLHAAWVEEQSKKIFIPGTTLEIDVKNGTVSYEQLEEFFENDYEAFQTFMRGQTSTSKGFYAVDVIKYIKGDRNIQD